MAVQKKVVNVSAEQIYPRALTLAKVRSEVNLATVLCYPLTLIQPSLFNDEGSRHKTNKRDFLHALDDIVKKSVTKLPNPSLDHSVHTTDAMAFLRIFRVEKMKT